MLQTRDDWDCLPIAMKFSAVVQFVVDEYHKHGVATSRQFDRNRPDWMPSAGGLSVTFALEWREIQALANVPISGQTRHRADGVALCECGQSISTGRVVILGGINGPTYTRILPLCEHCAAILDEDEELQEVLA